MAICLNCQHVNPDDHQFCAQCGSVMTLLQRYRAIQILGQGGFGVTYLAQDEAKPSKPHCVIKQFSYIGPGQSKAAELFEAESTRLENLGKHPQIPALYAHCQQKGQQFLVQEFIDGQDLDKELRAEGAFDEAKIRALLLDVLPILDFIHQNQVIHRDIKPSNIMRRNSDRKLVLVDFGAAKQASLTALQKTGTVIGSAEYTAPEQTRGRAVFASDLYSLGVTCLHLLTDVEPFNLKNNDEEWVWRDYLTGKKIGTELGKVLDRMVLPVSRRYGSAAEVLEVLNALPRGKTRRNFLMWTGLGIGGAGAALLGDRLRPQSAAIRTDPPPTLPPMPPAPVPTPNKISTPLKRQMISFETVFVDDRGEIVRREKRQAAQYVETLRRREGAEYVEQHRRLPETERLELLRIPGGQFIMGSPWGEDGSLPSTTPQREVKVSSFWMGKFAVTKAQWFALMTGYDAYDGDNWWRNYSTNLDDKFKGDKRPIVMVSWQDAQEFCRRLSQRSGKTYRLPSEAEWEYACRAGTTTPFHYGANITTDLVNYNGINLSYRNRKAPNGTDRGQTTNVGSFPPNGFGLYDMHGNVWEWCEDVWHDTYAYPGAPTDGSAWLTGWDRNVRLLRGGSWNDRQIYCSSASRSSNDSNFRFMSGGFRVCLSAP
ncbi:MAG: SUMF1/EgtB/PvdO family nonheme iron enzyme [Oscillatoriales cyanobacterium SM2_2_1]|nr:SUMF1/EgtB/PvdO family nonheme iron enzyme [Oscillatoriales cyanobacterium SM2_2_1]